MNHYERLKVTQDAPAEVIRAAYRALANRLQAHPTAPGAGADAAQEEMMGLNAAYETLIDPMLRRDYDASLSATQGWQKPAHDEDGEGDGGDGQDALAVAEGSAPVLKAQESVFAPEPNQVMLGTFIALLLIVMGFAWYFTRSSTTGPSMDASVVKQIGEQSGASMEQLDGTVARPAFSAFPGLHPLDGPSIGLKPETQLRSARTAAERAAASGSADN